MLRNYLLVAIRNVWRNKTISFINIFGLAVSMTVCLLLIIIVTDQFTYDSFHSEEDRIYRIVTDRVQQREYKWETATIPYPLAASLKGQDGIEKIAVLKKNFEGTAAWDQSEIPFKGLFANNDFLQVFNFPLEKGSSSDVLSLPNSIVLTNKLAIKLFGEKSPLGETIEIENVGEYIVTGVLQNFPGKTHFEFEALASTEGLPLLEKEGRLLAPLTDWENIYDNYIYIKTNETFNEVKFNKLLSEMANSNYEKDGEFDYTFKLQSLSNITLGPLKSNTMGFGLPSFIVYILLGLALIVLFSACFNYANLTTARAMKRAKEIGVRKVIGASKKHIIFQFLVEAIVITFIAFGLSALMVEYLHPALNNMFVNLGAPIRFDKVNYLYLIYVGFAVLTGLIAGIVPALFFSTTNALVALKKSINLEKFGKRIGIAKFSIKKVLVVAQFAFSIFFVVTIITIYKQLNMVLTTDHGFKTENILNIKLEGMSYETIKNEFSTIPSVQAISATTYLPALGTNNGGEVKIPNSEESLFISYFGIGDNYLNSLDLTLLAGRDFPENMPNDERYTLINETAVKRLGWENPDEALGMVIQLEDTDLEIIGVMKDFHFERMDEEIGPMCLRYQPRAVNSMIVTILDKNEKETLAQLEQGWNKHTNRPFNYSYFKDDMAFSYAHYTAILAILGYITFIIVSLACLGLLGMVIFHIQNKTKEIGIRKTLGADTVDLVKTESKSFLILIGISYLIAGPLAYFVNNMWLQTNAYRVELGIGTLVLGFVMVLAIVVLTIGSQVYKALRINPVDSLKSE